VAGTDGTDVVVGEAAVVEGVVDVAVGMVVVAGVGDAESLADPQAPATIARDNMRAVNTKRGRDGKFMSVTIGGRGHVRNIRIRATHRTTVTIGVVVWQGLLRGQTPTTCRRG